MKAGKLRHRVIIEQETKTQSSSGAWTSAWSEYATVWAQIEPLSASERMQANQLGASETHKVTIRYRSGVTTQMRVAFGSRTLNINGIINRDERNVELTLMCEEVVN